MPVIPVFEAQPNAQAARLPMADPGAFAAPGMALQQAGGEFGGLGEQFEQRYVAAKQQADAANISANLTAQADVLRRQASLVPDHVAAINQFNQGYSKLRDAALQGIADPLVQSYVAQHSATTGEIFASQVGTESFQREAGAQQATNDQQRLDALNRIAANTDPLARAHEIDSYVAATHGLAVGGFLSPEEAQRRVTDFRFRISQDDVMRDAAASPAVTYQVLSDPARRAAAYPYLPPEWADHFAVRLEGRAAAERGRAAGIAALGGSVAGAPGAVGIPDDYAPLVNAAANDSGVPANILGAVARRESGWNPALTGTAGEIGLGQIKPGTASEPGYGVAPVDPDSLRDPGANLSFTAQYLAGLGRHFGVTDWSDPEQVRPVLEAYNGSGHKQAYGQEVLTLAGMTTGKAPASAPDFDAALERVPELLPGDEAGQFHAASEIRRQEAAWNHAHAADREQLRHDITDVSAALESGANVDIPTDRINALLPPEKAREVIQTLGVEQVMGTMTAALRFASPEEVDSIVHDLEQGTGPAGTALNTRLAKLGFAPGAVTGDVNTGNFAVRAKMLELLQNAVAARKAGLASDPAGYVAQEPTVAAAFKGIDPKDPATFERYATATQAVQSRMGVAEGDTRVLPLRQSQALARQLLNTDPATGDAGAAIDNMAGQFGAAWPQAWHDIVRDGKLPAPWQVLGSMPPGADRLELQRALQDAAKKGGVENMRADINKKVASAIDDALDGDLDDFRRTLMVPGLPGDTGAFSAVRDAARLLAYRNVLTSTDSADGAAAAQKAVAAVTPFDIDAAHPRFALARVPKGQGALAEQVGDSLLDNLSGATLATVGGGMGMRNQDRQDAYARSLKANGVWLTNTAGDGLVLGVRDQNGTWQFPTTDGGRRIGFKFADMPAFARTQQAAPGPNLEGSGGE